MNTLKELVLQGADTQKILLKIQTFMECALEVRAGAWRSRELPSFPALLHIFPGVSEPPRTGLYLYCSGDGFALVELCVWAVLRNRYRSQAEQRLATDVAATVCTMTKRSHYNVFLGHLWVILTPSPLLSPRSVLPQDASVSRAILLWATEDRA